MLSMTDVGIYNEMFDSNNNGSDKDGKEPYLINVDLIKILDSFPDDVEWVDINSSKLFIKDYSPSLGGYKYFDNEVLEMILDAEEDDADFNFYDEIRKRATLVKFNTKALKSAIEINRIYSLLGKFSLIENTVYNNGKPYLYMIG